MVNLAQTLWPWLYGHSIITVTFAITYYMNFVDDSTVRAEASHNVGCCESIFGHGARVARDWIEFKGKNDKQS